MNNESYWQLLQLRVFEKRISEAVVFLRQHDIEPMLIKGWVAAQVYPNVLERGYTDIDLIIAPERYAAAKSCLENYSDNYLLDLHKGAKSLDTLSYESLYNNSKIVNCGDSEVRVLCAEDHLRILCVHWLIGGGAREDRLWDIYHSIENRPVDFNWERFLNVVSETRRHWIVCVIGLTHRYLGLNLKNTPFEQQEIDIPSWLIKAVEKEWQSGIPILSLEHCLGSRKRFWQQIKKRIPPNPVQATVEMEGKFDNRPRIIYQTGNTFQRLKPMFGRVWKKLFLK